jgi:hypothetical protein
MYSKDVPDHFWLPCRHIPTYSEILEIREFDRQQRIDRMLTKLARKLKILNE